ncbi:hypothetical protein EW146_g6776 [Bondarzewia mesenterica]|uniref:DUF6532 domain-containing protein n=1 Tax=Bondarzewia mesenterica TaxID=1095465 RepID=A0A4S4LPE3_9AGAM|nr:hypothetical protein EW146_g6776 [Bondarzewia mesenterica]
MGTLINPWDTSDMVSQLQMLWNGVFNFVPHTVSAHGDPVHFLCNGFTIAAAATVEAYWDSDKAYETAGEQAEYAAWAIGYHVPFLWGSINDTDPMNPVFSEAFQTLWVYMVFAHHLSALGGLASEYMSHKMPVGALILTAVALEHALSMWTTGNLKRHDVKSENTFFETNWGEKSAEYSLSIQQLPAASWEVIKMNSLKYMRSHKGGTLIRASEAVAAGNLSVRGSIVDRDRYQE